MKVEFTIPLSKDLIPSEANRGGEHWTKKHKRHQQQKFLINAYMTSRAPPISSMFPCMISLTRISPRILDEEDNLPMAFKSWKDYIADYLIPGKPMGQADSDKRLKWVYAQEKGKPKEYALKVQIDTILSL
jgi:hypothetical protein